MIHSFAAGLKLARLAVVAALLIPALLTATATAHESNPDYESTVRAIKPPTEGFTARIAGGDDRIVATNRSDQRVVIRGYEDEPYVRLEPNGDVFVNERSPAFYLNEERLGRVEVPDSANPKASPQWQKVGQAYRYEWHDHRAHWMGQGVPGAVKDQAVRTKVFDWQVPVEIGKSEGAIVGDLYWRGANEGGSPTSTATIVFASVVVLMLIIGAAMLILRRRGGEASGDKRESW